MTINPFDLKSALLAKHAQHVVLVHFPIALFISSFVFDLLAIGTGIRSASYLGFIRDQKANPAFITCRPEVETGCRREASKVPGE